MRETQVCRFFTRSGRYVSSSSYDMHVPSSSYEMHASSPSYGRFFTSSARQGASAGGLEAGVGEMGAGGIGGGMNGAGGVGGAMKMVLDTTVTLLDIPFSTSFDVHVRLELQQLDHRTMLSSESLPPCPLI